MTDHDALYHRLFSHPGLVRSCWAGSWTSRGSPTSTWAARSGSTPEFHTEDDDRREGDVIWRIPLRRGGDAYLLLLLEFQSSPDRWMALRAMVYAGLLWQQVVAEKRLGPDGRLPPVFPLVVYTGTGAGRCRWHCRR